MAQPTNTLSSLDVRGIREDLADDIWDISPEETPFTSSMSKMKASNTYVEWQTDALRASADNAHIEGDETVAEARTATTRVGYRCQIFKNAVVIPGTDMGLKKAGRASEMDYQIVKITKEHKLDIEKAAFANQAQVARTDSLAGRLAGVGAWIKTNTNNVGGGGADPTGDGTNARTDGSQTAFGQTDFDLTMQEIWTAGGRPQTVYLSAFQMQIAQGFTGHNGAQSNIDAAKNKVIKYVAVYVTPWGTIEFVPTRENRGRDVWIMQDDMWALAQLRTTRNEALAKTGDSERRQIVTELTLVCKNEAANGGVVDCSTS